MKMNIHRALAELKTIDKRIEAAIQSLNFVGILQKGKKVNGVYDPEEFAKTAKADFQSVKDLIERKAKIKSLIVESNSKTKVTIGKETMTVADAITKKANVAQEKALISKLAHGINHARQHAETQNQKVAQNLQVILEATFGKDSSKADPSQIKATTEAFNEQNLYQVVDPINAEQKVREMQEKITEFEAEIDAALSTSNAITEIEL